MADETRDEEIHQNEDAPESAAEGGGDVEVEALDPELAVPRGREVVSVLEALLFAATTPLKTKRLSVLMNGVPEEEVTEALAELKERYDGPDSGLTLMEVAGGWQVATSPDAADWVLRLHKHRRRAALSPALLETLAIIAYKQPLTRAEVEAIRGVDCGSGLRSLQDAGLVEVVGRKESLGRPPLYGTTDLFLKTFGLKDIENLPALGDLKAVMEAPMKTKEEAEGEEAEPEEGETTDESSEEESTSNSG